MEKKKKLPPDSSHKLKLRNRLRRQKHQLQQIMDEFLLQRRVRRNGDGIINLTAKKRYVIIRTYSAGVHAGTLIRKVGKEVTLKNSRRIWYWDGAASLSELSVRGVSKPLTCKFPVAVPEITLTEAIEIIPCSTVAQKCIEGVPEWKA